MEQFLWWVRSFFFSRGYAYISVVYGMIGDRLCVFKKPCVHKIATKVNSFLFRCFTISYLTTLIKRTRSREIPAPQGWQTVPSEHFKRRVCTVALKNAGRSVRIFLLIVILFPLAFLGISETFLSIIANFEFIFYKISTLSDHLYLFWCLYRRELTFKIFDRSILGPKFRKITLEIFKILWWTPQVIIRILCWHRGTIHKKNFIPRWSHTYGVYLRSGWWCIFIYFLF